MTAGQTGCKNGADRPRWITGPASVHDAPLSGRSMLRASKLPGRLHGRTGHPGLHPNPFEHPKPPSMSAPGAYGYKMPFHKVKIAWSRFPDGCVPRGGVRAAASGGSCGYRTIAEETAFGVSGMPTPKRFCSLPVRRLRCSSHNISWRTQPERPERVRTGIRP